MLACAYGKIPELNELLKQDPNLITKRVSMVDRGVASSVLARLSFKPLFPLSCPYFPLSLSQSVMYFL